MPITKVDYLVDGAVIGTTTVEPFNQFTWAGSVTPATYSITAKIYVDGVLSHTSPAVDIFVQEPSNNFPDWFINGDESIQFKAALDNSFPVAFNSVVNLGVIANGKGRGCISAPNGMLFTLPHDSSFVRKINTNNNTVSNIDTGITSGGGNEKWHTGILGNNNKIYAAPYISNNQILVINTVNDTTYTITVPSLATNQYFYYSMVKAHSGLIYCFPAFATNEVLIIDPIDDSVTIWNIPIDFDHSSILGLDGLIYLSGIVDSVRSLVIVNPANNTYTTEAMTINLNTSVMGHDGHIYHLENSNYDFARVKKFNIATREISAVATGPWNDNDDTSRPLIMGPDNHLYVIPTGRDSISYTNWISKINLDTNVITKIYESGTSSPVSFSGGALAPNGKIYMIPTAGYTQIGTIGDGAITVSENYVLSRYINKGN